MEANSPHPVEPWIFIEGIDEIIRRDLEKHKALLEREQTNLLAYQESVAHAIEQKRHYRKLIGGGKYNDDALHNSIAQQKINVRHLQDKVKLTKEAIAHHALIVDTLSQQLKNYEKAHAAANRRLQ